MTSRVPTVLVTADHLFRCNVDTQGVRLLDKLNDSSTKFLEVFDVEIYRRANSTIVHSEQSAVIDKNDVVFAIPATKKHEAPAKRVTSYNSKRSYNVFLIASGYEIQGKLQTNVSEDPATLLTRHGEEFLAFPEASVSYGACDDDQPAVQVALVNTRYISLFKLSKNDDLSQSLADALREIVAS